jgi:hypothetical protein
MEKRLDGEVTRVEEQLTLDELSPGTNIIPFPRSGKEADAQDAMASPKGEADARVIPLFFRQVNESVACDALRLDLDAENERLALLLTARRERMKELFQDDPHRLKGIRELEVLDGLLSMQDDNVLMVESLQYKKNLIFAQYDLPLEYMQADNVTRQLVTFNKTLTVLTQEQAQASSRLMLQTMKQELQRELEALDCQLLERYAPQGKANGARSPMQLLQSILGLLRQMH